MPHVRILTGSQAGAIDEQDISTAEVSVLTGFAEYVEPVNGTWTKVDKPGQKVAAPAEAPKAPAPKAAKPAKAKGKK